jgi:hypothetical protein
MPAPPNCPRRQIPWRKLTSAPSTIEIDRIYAVAVPKTELVHDEAREAQRAGAAKAAEIAALDAAAAAASAAHAHAGSGDAGFVTRLLIKVVENLVVKVNSIHIRVEDRSSDAAHPFSMGVLLSGLTLRYAEEAAAGGGGMPGLPAAGSSLAGVIRKVVVMEAFAIYLNSANFVPVDTSSAPALMRDMAVALSGQEQVQGTAVGGELGEGGRALSSGALQRLSHRGGAGAGGAMGASTAGGAAPAAVALRPLQYIAAPVNWTVILFIDDSMVGGSGKKKTGGAGSGAPAGAPAAGAAAGPAGVDSAMIRVAGSVEHFSLLLSEHQYRDLLSFVATISNFSTRALYARFRPQGTPYSGSRAAVRAWWRFATQAVRAKVAAVLRARCWRRLVQQARAAREYTALFAQVRVHAALFDVLPAAKLPAAPAGRLAALEDALSVAAIAASRKAAVEQVKAAAKAQAELLGLPWPPVVAKPAAKPEGWGAWAGSLFSRRPAASAAGSGQASESESSADIASALVSSVDLSSYRKEIEESGTVDWAALPSETVFANATFTVQRFVVSLLSGNGEVPPAKAGVAGACADPQRSAASTLACFEVDTVRVLVLKRAARLSLQASMHTLQLADHATRGTQFPIIIGRTPAAVGKGPASDLLQLELEMPPPPRAGLAAASSRESKGPEDHVQTAAAGEIAMSVKVGVSLRS